MGRKYTWDYDDSQCENCQANKHDKCPEKGKEPDQCLCGCH